MKTKLTLGTLVALLGAAAGLVAQPQPGTVLWTYDFAPIGGYGSPASPSPALASDGTIYLGTYFGLQALTNTGSSASNQWTFPASTISGVSVGPDGTIFVANASQYFYALNPDGSQKWAYAFATAGSSQPAIGRDGTVYVVADGSLYALTSGGTKKWAYGIGSNGGVPALGADGTVYVRISQWPTNFYALNPNGTLKWAKQLQPHPLESLIDVGIPPAIGADGTVYVGGAGLYAFTPQGAQLWFNNTNDLIGVVLGNDGTIYTGGWMNATLYALRSSGEYKWHVYFPYRIASKWCWPPTTPAIDASGTLYYTAPNSIFAISSEGQVQWVVSHPNPQGSPVLDASSPVIAPDGTIYATVTNTLFAIVGTSPLGDTPWPMYQQNARHTGKVEKPVLKPPQKRSDANLQFQLYPHQLGLTYTIESSTNLNFWTTLTRFVATNVPMDVVDLTATNFPARFYRAVSP